MAIDYLLPAPLLAPFVSIHCRVSGVGEPVMQTLPAMLANLHFRLAGRARYHFADGSVVDAPRAGLVTTTGAFRIEMSADFAMIGTGLLPLGWETFVGASAAGFGDGVVEAAGLWSPALVDTTWHALGDAFATTGWGVPLDRMLLALPARRARADRIGAVDAWLEGPGALSVDMLAAALDLSARQTMRVTLDAYGFAPKALALRYRALRAASTLAVGGAPAMAVAAEGYTDQSHMIRDFHRVIGWTPAAFCRAPNALAAASMAGRWRAGARRPLTMWS